MVDGQHRILCLGTETNHLEVRCAVLHCAGYEAHAVTVPEGYQQLRTGQYDLVVVSAGLVDAQRSRFYQALPGGTKTLLLDGFILPADLLRLVARRLHESA